jgi:hypothetical protein
MLSADEIARALGGKRHGAYWIARCPAHDDRSPSLSIRQGDIGPLVKCHAGCDQRDVIAALRHLGLWPDRGEKADWKPPPKKDRKPEPDNRASAQAIWRESVSPLDTPVEVYLASRGCGLLLAEMAGRVIRYNPNCWFGEPVRRRFPAMIALYRDIRTDEPRAIHRTALTLDGAAFLFDNNKVRQVLAPTAGAAIKLSPDADVCQGLGIAEGIETALSVMHVGWRPVWALGTAGGIAAFPVLDGIDHLTVFGDNDYSGTGQAAAETVERRWLQAGQECRVRWPKTPGHDWNDEVML